MAVYKQGINHDKLSIIRAWGGLLCTRPVEKRTAAEPLSKRKTDCQHNAVTRDLTSNTVPCNTSSLDDILQGKAMRPAVGYIRVSTARQGRSGLGLESQQAALARFCATESFNLVETFTETESGADDNRPQLNAAIEHACKIK